MKTPHMAALGQHSKPLAIALTALFSVLSVITLVQLVGRLSNAPTLQAVGAAPTSARPDQTGGAEIADWHLFGEAARDAQPIRQPGAGAPRRDLVLRGTLTANDPGLARAIVADGQGFERAYRIGDSLPGNMELAAIHTDHIVVHGERGDENIYLPREEQSSDAPATARQSSTQTITADASALRGELLRNPTLLAEAVVPMPVWQNNECKGYRFRPGKDATFMRQVGLLSTDVVSAVNGIQLCSDGVLDALQSLAMADEVTVSIIRDGQPVELNVRLKN